MNAYYENVTALLSEIRSTQADAIEAAGKVVGETVRAEGIVHTFGSGHSAAVAYEAHGRAGDNLFRLGLGQTGQAEY